MAGGRDRADRLDGGLSRGGRKNGVAPEHGLHPFRAAMAEIRIGVSGWSYYQVASAITRSTDELYFGYEDRDLRAR